MTLSEASPGPTRGALGRTPLEVEVVREDGALARLSWEWDALLAVTPAWSGFQSCAWIAAARGTCGADTSLFTLRFRDDHETVALLPTQLGRAGDLRFVGAGVSNYLGPVYRADRLADVMQALARFLAAERQITLVDFQGLREHSPILDALRTLSVPGWTAARLVRTASCPYIDLAPGWEGVYARHKSSQRANLARKWRTLEQLGRLEFVEVTDPEETRDLLPALFDLYRERWTGRHESGGFAGRNQAFHTLAAPALAADGLLRISLLRLDDEPIAFAYGIRGAHGVTSSYVLAHTNVLSVHSPGILLLTRVLEAACARGESEYDLSIGDEEYKARWATGSRAVYRVLLARESPMARARGVVRRVASQAWVAARSVEWLRRLRREGVARTVRGHRLPPAAPDTPGIAAGKAGEWYVSRIRAGDADRSASISGWSYREMKDALSPRLLLEAIDRNFRGDRLLAVRRRGELVGVVWAASKSRRPVVTGGCGLGPGDDVVYYHPAAAPGHGSAEVVDALRRVGRGTRFVLVAPEDLRVAASTALGSFGADLRFTLPPAPAAPPPATGEPAPTPASRPVGHGTWEVVDHDDALEALAPEWQALAATTSLPAFAGPGLALAFRNAFLPEAGSVTVHVLRRDGELAAVLPLHRQGTMFRSWTPLVNEHVPCLAFAIARDAPEVVRAVLDHLLDGTDHLALHPLALGGTQARALRAAAAALGLRVFGHRLRGGDLSLQLPRPWEAFEATIPTKLRSGVRRRLARLEEAGPLRLECVTGGESLAAVLAECLDVEARGWKGASGSPIKRTPHLARFYGELAERMSAVGQLALYVLRVDERAIAFKYCVRNGDRLDSLKTSFDPAFATYGPGVAILHLIARHEIAAGTATAIHLGGPDPHKLHWSTAVVPLERLDVYGRGLRGAAAAVAPRLASGLQALGPIRSATGRVGRVAERARVAAHGWRVALGKRLSR